jgi:phosphatidylinositol-3-phosphatase
MRDRIGRWAANLGIGAIGALLALTAQGSPAKLAQHPIRHVFIIVLENKNYADTFSASTQDPYLRKTLPAMGALLSQYYGTGHYSLDNYISMISGQSSSRATEEDCSQFADFALTGMSEDGQAAGTGCVYPSSIKTLADQLAAAGLTWKAYMEDMGNDPSREAAACGHPALNTKDLTQSPEAPSASVAGGDQYATRHNPFMYFHSVIDSPACGARDVSLKALEADLGRERSTPNFAFITPNLCNDGHDGSGTGAPGERCVDGKPGGLASADAFLKTWVPKILASAAYRKDGLLIVTFDEGNDSAQYSRKDPAGGKTTVTQIYAGEHCCGQRIGPNVTRPLTQTFVDSPTLTYVIDFQGYGGDRIGAVLLSPFIKPGTVSAVPYNHYSLLRSLEDIFGLGHLGYAGQRGLAAFGDDIFTDF